ncbi:MAG: transglycosylase SLT domain-containing protein [Anaerolineae bacterium]|jgi:hypothetical protein|nr:transglycosylase SLT domain-containing protein [Anaerolineae bacterium]MBT7071795.1 transglycosylase SLT domain-containing protein [Anaerolineae bacterium]MBT7324042.1 transglycosylase SLT domain-containing protein [Anaerolineae bacterium]
MSDYYGDEDDYPEEEYWEAADESETGNGCLSIFFFPPLVVLISGIFMAIFLWGIKTPAQADGELAGPYAEEYANHPGLSPLFTPEVQFWGDQIMLWASQTGLDPNLIATVMQIESCGDPRATSGAGAMGLFQVMPYHFESGENPYLPDTNALRGLGYLKQSLGSANGDARLAFAGYNGGISVIAKAESSWAAETVRYVYWGSGIYANALQGATRSDRLDEWLGHGGASLCAQAATRQ